MGGEGVDRVRQERAGERVHLLLAAQAVRDEALVAGEAVHELEKAHLLLGRALGERDLEDLLRERERVVLVVEHQDLGDVQEGRFGDDASAEIGRASCRERVFAV